MEKNKENLTPLMQQYERLKAQHPNEILLFRLGDFYEMFGEDAKTASPVLEVALTQRQGIPMCGIPFHAVDRYLSKLLKKGLRVAIAEQMEDPAMVKGIVKRDVTRMISAGTIIEENLLKEKTNNFLAAVVLTTFSPSPPGLRHIVGVPSPSPLKGEGYPLAGLAALDVSTGQFILTEVDGSPDFTNFQSELSRLNPAELVLLEGQDYPAAILDGIPIQKISDSELQNLEPEEKKVFESEEWKKRPFAVQAGKMLQSYVRKMNPAFLKNVQPPQYFSQSESMALDRETLENLEILKNSYDGSTEKTVLSFLDSTLTPMGGRLLKQWLSHPLVQPDRIKNRLDAVDFFLEHGTIRKQCREILRGVSDLERIMVRLGTGHANPRDLLGMKISLMKIKEAKAVLSNPPPLMGGGEARHDLLAGEGAGAIFYSIPQPMEILIKQLGDGSNIIDLIQNAIAEDPPITLDQGGVIRSGYDPNLDEKRQAAEEGKQWLQDLEIKEKQSTGISTLKVGYTSVFGYYMEVTKPHLSKVPPSWYRKQTLINAERFVNEELKKLESKILGAEEQALRMERALFQNVVQALEQKSAGIQTIALASAQLDCLLSLAEAAETKSLVRPKIDESNELNVIDGWHPVVKESLPAGAFVPNDIELGMDTRIIILTGPNMSGKSTYLRQTAIIVLMAQIGSFVPAKEAHIGLTDRIFTRIGSGDRLAQGESTFMVEMHETAKILKHATSKSLIILDEVGRGTSTYDGISIAWSIVEYLAKQLRPKVLFATHYFELTDLADRMEGIKNYNVQAKEWQDSVIFLHKIVPGSADRSYGIHVAQLAGLPEEVVQRAKNILEKLEQKHHSLVESNQQELFL